MRWLIVLLLLVLVLPLGALQLLGVSPMAIPAAIGVGTGLTAKLACSGHYLSGFSDEQNLRDIATYSPLASLVTMRRAGPDTFHADLMGLGAASARFYPGLGCTLEYPGMADLAGLQPPGHIPGPGMWPAGPEVGSYREDIQSVLDALLEEDNALGLDTRALVVVQGGNIVAETYADGIEVDTPLLGWSMGKSVSAMLIGRMEAMGLVDPAETDLFPPWRNDERREISLLNLLQMSSGLDFSEPYIPGSDSTRMLFLSPSAADVAMSSPLAHTPGSHFYYSSGTSNLLTRLAWDRLGGDSQALLDFFAAEIAAPLGLRATTLELDASGVFVGSSYIYAPARDWGRLGQLMLNDGRVGDRQLLPRGWTARAAAPNASSNDPRYGYQFWLNRGGNSLRWPALRDDAYAMMGNRGQVVMMLPGLDAVVVRLGWTATDYDPNARMLPLQRVLSGEG